MSDLRKLPCGHLGRYVFAQFALCSKPGCDTRPKPRSCGKCGSGDLYEFQSPSVPDHSLACRVCGAISWAPGD